MILMFIISIIFCLGGAIAIDVGLIVTGAIAATLGFILFFYGSQRDNLQQTYGGLKNDKCNN